MFVLSLWEIFRGTAPQMKWWYLTPGEHTTRLHEVNRLGAHGQKIRS